MQKSFYNTVNTTGDQLVMHHETAAALEKRVHELFKANAGLKLRTIDVENSLRSNHDSTKRAITNLTTAGKLIRSAKASVPGPFGVPVNTWQLANQPLNNK